MSVDKNQIMQLNCGIVIVTEDVDGNPYVINYEYFSDLIDDWNGERDICPSDDARVFFAMYNYEPINPFKYSDFESLMELMIEE